MKRTKDESRIQTEKWKIKLKNVLIASIGKEQKRRPLRAKVGNCRMIENGKIKKRQTNGKMTARKSK